MTPVNANPGEYKSPIGLDSIYIALITQDDAAGYVAETPQWFAPAAEASQEPSSSFEIQFADDGPFDVMTAEGETKITLTVTGLPLELQALINGRVFDSATGRIFDQAGVAPYFALGFRSLRSSGGYRYFWYLKGKFDSIKEEATTKKAQPEPKTIQVTFTAIKTTYKWTLADSSVNTLKRVVGDDDVTNFSATGWFSAVQVPGSSAPSALALSSSSPVDNATGVLVGADLTLTFNNALVNAAINNVALIKASDASVFTTVRSLNAGKTIMTVNPTGNLAAATEYYIMINGVADVYGQTLTTVVSFTTA